MVAKPSPTAAVAWTPAVRDQDRSAVHRDCRRAVPAGAAGRRRADPPRHPEPGEDLAADHHRPCWPSPTPAASPGSTPPWGWRSPPPGGLFAFFSPLLGWLGVALTGSGRATPMPCSATCSEITAQQVGQARSSPRPPNSSGGVMAKMIDAQNIVVAGIATGQRGNEGEILRYGFWHAVGLRLPDGRAGVPAVQPAFLDDPRLAAPVARRGR